VNIVEHLKIRKQEIKDHEEMSLKAYEKFKKCRSEAMQNSLKKAKTMKMDVHFILYRFIATFLKVWRKRNRLSSSE
jgi:hypothetical protein